MSQGPHETAQDFITRVTRCAKDIPTPDDTMIQYAILQGLKPQVWSHVLAQSVPDILQAAKVAEVTVTSPTDPNLNQLLDERAPSPTHLISPRASVRRQGRRTMGCRWCRENQNLRTTSITRAAL